MLFLNNCSTNNTCKLQNATLTKIPDMSVMVFTLAEQVLIKNIELSSYQKVNDSVFDYESITHKEYKKDNYDDTDYFFDYDDIDEIIIPEMPYVPYDDLKLYPQDTLSFNAHKTQAEDDLPLGCDDIYDTESLLQEPDTKLPKKDFFTPNHLFDDELKGAYSHPESKIKESYERISNLMDILTQKGSVDELISFILVYKDRNSDKLNLFYANDEESEVFATQKACDFFERNCDYKDFTARWLPDICNTSAYARNMVRVITATNTRTNEREVIYISKNVGVSRYNNTVKPEKNVSFEEQPLSGFADIECVITGLIVIGSLSFGEEELEARGDTFDNYPKISAVRISEADSSEPDDGSVEGLKDIDSFRYISGITSNDPSYADIWYSSNQTSDMDYSAHSHKQRWSKVNKSIKGMNLQLPSVAPTLLERVWVNGSMSNSSYYSLTAKRSFTPSLLKNSLLYNDQFLKLFVEISGKKSELSIRRITGAKDAFHIFFNCNDLHLDRKFIPKEIFKINISKDSDYWTSDYSLFSTIIEGWSGYAVSLMNWNKEQKPLSVGEFKEVASSWLFTLVSQIYFRRGVCTPKTVRPDSLLLSMPFKDVEVITKGLVSSYDTESLPASRRTSESDISSTLFGFRLGYVQLSLGHSLFEIAASRNGSRKNYSFFLGGDNNGFLAYKQSCSDKNVIIIASDPKGVVESLWCLSDFNDAISIACDIILDSDTAKKEGEGMDVYDALREIETTANLYGVEMQATFRIPSQP